MLSQAAHSFQYVTHGKAAAAAAVAGQKRKLCKPKLKLRLGQAKQPPPQLRSLEAAAVAIHRRRESRILVGFLHTFQTRVYSFQ